MAHRRARLTPLGRLVVVERVLIHGWPAARVAEAASVSRPTVYKWVRRFLEEGLLEPHGMYGGLRAPNAGRFVTYPNLNASARST